MLLDLAVASWALLYLSTIFFTSRQIDDDFFCSTLYVSVSATVLRFVHLRRARGPGSPGGGCWLPGNER